MTLLWPGFIFLLVLIPIAAAAYLWALRRKRKSALRYSSLSLVRLALPGRSSLRRHVPPALFLLALACLIIALARPAAYTTVPGVQATIILAIDVSGSMAFNDVPPTRLAAAEDVISSFINRQKAYTRIGIVDFSSSAQLILPPTTDHDTLIAAVHSLTTGQQTAIGSGILTSLDTIARLNPPVNAAKKNGSAHNALPKGVYAPEIIVLLTDGVNNMGPKPQEAAQAAAERGVRVYTIGFGTEYGPFLFSDPSSGPVPIIPRTGSIPERGIDEETLKTVAKTTGGKYYSAESAGELEKVFASLPVSLVKLREEQEIGTIFAAAGALLLAAAMALGTLWHPIP